MSTISQLKNFHRNTLRGLLEPLLLSNVLRRDGARATLDDARHTTSNPHNNVPPSPLVECRVISNIFEALGHRHDPPICTRSDSVSPVASDIVQVSLSGCRCPGVVFRRSSMSLDLTAAETPVDGREHRRFVARHSLRTRHHRGDAPRSPFALPLSNPAFDDRASRASAKPERRLSLDVGGLQKNDEKLTPSRCCDTPATRAAAAGLRSHAARLGQQSY